MGGLDAKEPINTQEFLAWVTQDRKRQQRTSIIVALVITVFMAVISGTAIFASRVASHATDEALQNQKDIASLRAFRNDAVSVNEIGLCKIVYTIIERQKQIANIVTNDPVFEEHRSDQAFIRRQIAAQSLDKEIIHSTLPKCDGFPGAPAP